MRSIGWLVVAALLGCGEGGGGAPDGGGADAADSSVTSDGGDGGGDAGIGLFDPTFGDAGVATTAFASVGGRLHGLAILRQSDGKLLFISQDFANDGLLVARVDPATKLLDPSYGRSGLTLLHGLPFVPDFLDFAGGQANPAGDTILGGAALQSDGKLVVAEDLGLGGTDVVRLDASGAIDPSFGQGGHARLASLFSCSVAIQSDGKIVLAGGGTNATGPRPIVVARLDTTGASDATFGTAGLVTTPIGTATTSYAWADTVAIDPKGRIVAEGPSGDTIAGGALVFVARYTSSGALDTSFATTGLSITAITPSGWTNIHPLAVQADSRILVGGYQGTTVNPPEIVERLDEDGTIDATFGTAGVATVGAGDMGVEALAVGPDGSIGVVLYYSVRRLTTSGAIDSSFQSTFPPLGNFVPQSLAIRADGTYDLVGSVSTYAEDAEIVHLLPSGAYDPNAYSVGSLALPGPSATEVLALAVQPDGNIVAGGAFWEEGAAIARYLPSGALDPSFNAKLSPGTFNGANVAPLRALALDASGRIVLAGGGSYGTTAFQAARLMPDGTYDSSFASGGYGTFAVSGLNQARGRAMAFDASGRIVLAGDGDFYSPSPGGTDFAVVRLTSAGTFDATLGSGGSARVTVGGGRDATALATVVQPDGKILVAGTAAQSGKLEMAVVRLQDDGTLDTTFSGGAPGSGTILLDVSQKTTTSDVARAIVLQSDGKILLVGSSSSPVLDFVRADYVRSTSSSVVVARLLPSGALDTSFGTGGIFSSTLGVAGGMAFGATLASDGRILVGGRLFDGTTERGFVVRLTSAGALDASFATQGVETLDVGAESGVRALAFQPDGKLVIAGHTFGDPTGVDFAVARLLPN